MIPWGKIVRTKERNIMQEKNEQVKGKQTNENTVPLRHKQGAEEDIIDLEEVFYLFWGHIWLIIAAMVVGGVIAFTYTYLRIEPTYQASSEIYVVSASKDSVINMSDLQLGSSLTADYQHLLLKRPVLEAIIDNLSLNMSTGGLMSMISISNPTGTRALRITVTSTDPKLAADVANEMAEQAVIYLPEVMESASAPHIVEEALVPTASMGPDYSKNTLMGALVGAVVCCAVLLIPYLLNDTIVTPDDLVHNFGTYPLATIPYGDEQDSISGRYGRKYGYGRGYGYGRKEGK